MCIMVTMFFMLNVKHKGVNQNGKRREKGVTMTLHQIETAAEAAKKLGVSRQMISLLIKDGTVPATAWKKSGKALLVDMVFLKKLYGGQNEK